MAPRKRKAVETLEEGDNIVVTPASQLVNKPARFLSNSSPLVPTLSIFINNTEAQGTASAGALDDIPWTQREKLELLKVHEDYSNNNRNEKATYLHQKMERIRSSAGEPEQPKRSGYEFVSMLRELRNNNITIEDLEIDDTNALEEDKKPAKKTKTVKGKKTKTTRDLDRYYEAKAIVDETDTEYKISWENDGETGEVFEDTWEPHKNANRALVRAWEEQKLSNRGNGV